jgi:rod shape determining protein RodA
LNRRETIFENLDWITILIYLFLVISGWLTIHAAIFETDSSMTPFDLDIRSGKQLIWIFISFLLIVPVLVIDYKFFMTFAVPIYLFSILLLLAVLFIGTEVSGSKSWFQLGGIKIQPSEVTKYATALVLASLMDTLNFDIRKPRNFLLMIFLIGLPAGLIILQGDTGSALVFSAFFLVFFREGLSAIFIFLGIATLVLFLGTLLLGMNTMFILLAALFVLMLLFSLRNKKRILIIGSGLILAGVMVFSVDFLFHNVLKPHQQNRIQVFLNPNSDPTGAGWQVTQSKIAIGSGGFWGKGYLKGTQTKFDFIPDQSTDNIFCTVGEELGFVGSSILILGFSILLIRIIIISERQRTLFARVYGYAVFSIILFHYSVNIGMTIGLFPVVGIPLPFISYGGSALISFSLLLFTLLKLDAHRMQVLGRI